MLRRDAVCQRGGLAAAEGGEAVGKARAGVDGGGALLGGGPLGRVNRREECVGIGATGFDEGELEAVGAADGLAVDFGTADDEYLVGGGNKGDGFVDGVNDFGARGLEVGAAGHDDVAAARKCAFGERFEGLAAHDNGVAHGEGLEVAQVVADVESEAALAADGAVEADGGNQ